MIENENLNREKYADWKADSSERKSFSEVPETEQVERFRKLNQLFDTDSSYRDFWENVYKYPDRFKLEGMDNKQVGDVLNRTKNGVRLMEDILDCFHQIKLKETGQNNNLDFALQQIENLRHGTQFLANNKLDIPKLKDFLKWSFQAYISGADKIGRQVEISSEEVDSLVDDTEYILNKVNDYIG